MTLMVDLFLLLELGESAPECWEWMLLLGEERCWEKSYTEKIADHLLDGAHRRSQPSPSHLRARFDD